VEAEPVHVLVVGERRQDLELRVGGQVARRVGPRVVGLGGVVPHGVLVHLAVAVAVDAVAGVPHAGVHGRVGVVAVTLVLGPAVLVVVDGLRIRHGTGVRAAAVPTAVLGRAPAAGVVGDPGGGAQGAGRQGRRDQQEEERRNRRGHGGTVQGSAL